LAGRERDASASAGPVDDRPPTAVAPSPGRLRSGGGVHAAVAQAIGTRILRGDHPPGSILPSEAAWSAEFDASRTAVREAVKMLLAKGLLTSRPKIGSRVEPRENWNLLDHDVLRWYTALPGRRDLLRSLQGFRHIFEPEAAALAALNHSVEEMARITEACEAMGTATTLSQRSVADVQFHTAILHASGNELLLPLGTLIEAALNNLFVMITREAGSLRHAQELHEAIERAIRRRKPDAARRAVRSLLKNSDDLVDQIAQKSPAAD
jgi:DNA-binding FadR family transcriptional regulator